jgi:AGCS family alanine or glycine:cation symporter
MGSGIAGIVLIKALNAGISRGLFATDIGLGLAAIAHRNISSQHSLEQHAREQGITALLAPILVALLCSITGILIVCAAPNLDQDASKICVDAFTIAFQTSRAGWLIPIITYFFSFTTILACEWFAEHAFFFIQCARRRYYYRLIFIGVIAVGAFMHTSLPWVIADVCIDGLLLTNLLAIFSSKGIVIKGIAFRLSKKLCIVSGKLSQNHGTLSQTQGTKCLTFPIKSQKVRHRYRGSRKSCRLPLPAPPSRRAT